MGNNISVIRSRIEDLAETIENSANDLEERKDALDQIDDIILKKALTPDQTSIIIYNLIMSYANSEDDDFNKALVTVMHGLLANNTISDDNIEITKYFLLASALNPELVIKKRSIRALGDFLRKKINHLDENSSRQIINSLYENADNEDDVVRNNSIWNLNIIIEARKVPLDMQSQVINFLIGKLTDVDNEVKNRAMGGLSQLAISFTLKDNDLERVMNVFIKNVKDIDDNNRSSSLLGIANLAKKNLIPDNLIPEVIEILKSNSRDKHDDSRCNSTSTLQSLAKYNRIPEDKIKMVERNDPRKVDH